MSLFGEIVEPLSRTIWEECDFNEVAPDSDCKLKWKNEIALPTNAEKLLVFEGKYLSDYLKQQNDCKLEMINSVTEVNLSLLQVTGTTIFVCTIRDYDIILSSEIIELMKPLIINSDIVISVQMKPLTDYQTARLTDEYCIIRKVTTSKFDCVKSDDMSFTKLEQPNLISGVAAGVISMREHMDLSGIALICYLEYLGDYQIPEIQKLLKKLNVIQDTKLQPTGILESNLYI